MIKVTCQLDDYSEPSKPSIKVHNHWNNSNLIELEVDGVRYTVSASDLIAAINNATNTNNLGSILW